MIRSASDWRSIAVVWSLLVAGLPAQESPAGLRVFRPAAMDPGAPVDPAAPVPVIVVLPSEHDADLDALRAACVEAGFVVAWPARSTEPVELAAGLRQLRLELRVEDLRFHLVDLGSDARRAVETAVRHPFEFQTVLVRSGLADAAAEISRLRELRVDVELVEVDANAGAGAIVEQLTASRGRTRPDDAVVRAVAAALDDFHDAAAKADADRYFGRFAPDGVFLGTDPTERWTVEEFRKWAAFAFERDSAWIFVPQRRHIAIAPEGTVAWFDEVAGSAHYGECRGTGVLRLIDGEWRVAMYDLTVPVPNELLGDVVERIRAR
jgi:hypothetical protein